MKAINYYVSLHHFFIREKGRTFAGVQFDLCFTNEANETHNVVFSKRIEVIQDLRAKMASLDSKVLEYLKGQIRMTTNIKRLIASFKRKVIPLTFLSSYLKNWSFLIFAVLFPCFFFLNSELNLC